MKPFLLLSLALVVPTLAAHETRPPADKNPGRLKMALVNLRCVSSAGADAEANRANIAANLKRHLLYIDHAASKGAEFVGFPELSINGYQFSKTMTWLSLDGPEVAVLRKKAIEKGVYVSAGLAEKDSDGKTWNTQIVIDPQGKIIGKHHKVYLTKEKGFTEAGNEHKVFDVKGMKMGILICADGSDRKNLEALVEKGARLLYAPHANTTGGTTAGWYKFRDRWAGPDGWIARLKIHAVLHNHAAIYDAAIEPPTTKTPNGNWASGAWCIGPDGKSIAQMPSSTRKGDSKEFVLLVEIPTGR